MKRALLVALLLVSSQAALAHDVAVRTEVVKGKVHVEAHFSDGSPVGLVPVEVTNAAGKVLLTGHTTDKGVFDFAPPAKVDLTIKISIGFGHDATATVKAKDLEAGKK